MFLVAGQEQLFTFTRPEEGIWRISPSGDWTNAGTVSYTVDIWTSKETFPQHSAKAKIDNGESHVYTFDVPAGTAALETRLTWLNMNGNYPISDVDVILTPPSGPVVNSCNTRARRNCASWPTRWRARGRRGSWASASLTSASRRAASTTRCGWKQTTWC